MFLRKTKIVATVGPSSSSKSVLKTMVQAGVDVFRLNFSHGDTVFYDKIIENIKNINKELHKHTAILADLQGQKIRIGKIKEGTFLEKNKTITITEKRIIGNSKKIQIKYKDLHKTLNKGKKISIDDGKIVLKIESKSLSKKEIKCRIINGGELKSNKGVNFEDETKNKGALSYKDKKDLKYILSKQIEWVALSFVSKKQDVLDLKKIIDKNKSKTCIISKIENNKAVERIEEIVEVSDAIMVARGDLGIEIPLHKIPLIQKEIVKISNKYSKPVVIATHMLESMVEKLNPTRAEANDVANSVLDGADALMLSAETASGKNPTDSVRIMRKIIKDVETGAPVNSLKFNIQKDIERSVTDTICHHSCLLAEQVSAEAIITMTHSGYSAFKISSSRPPCMVYAFTENHFILNTLNLVWGVRGFYYNKTRSTDETIEDTQKILKEKTLIKKQDYVVNVASMPLKKKGMTNMVKLSKVK